jgi:hypothetical protein
VQPSLAMDSRAFQSFSVSSTFSGTYRTWISM